MTDLLLTPEDTGEIPTAVDPGPDTRNLAPYAAGLGPFLRKGELTEPVPYEPHTIGVVDDLATPGTPGTPGPDPTPPFPPPPPPPRPAYQGRHRAPARWYTPLVEGVAIAWARIRGAM
jgi:hypothetical protein